MPVTVSGRYMSPLFFLTAPAASFYVPIADWNDFHTRLRSIQTAAVDRDKKMADFCSELKKKQIVRSQVRRYPLVW